MNILRFKMPFKTNHFNKNQEVFVIELSGQQSALCSGRYRGKYNRIHAWVRWDKKEESEMPDMKEIDIPEENYNKIIGKIKVENEL